MWPKLGALAVGTAALLFVLLVPLLTLARIDQPPMAPGGPGHVHDAIPGAILIICAVIVLPVLVVAGFIARRIIRHHRDSKRDTAAAGA